MQLTIYFQLSLFGKTSWERFLQMTGWTLEPCYPRSTPPMFQCLLLEDGREPEWCEGERLTSHGGSWMPNIGQAPDWHDGSVSSSWRILEADVPTKYYLSPAQCAHFLKLAEIAGCPPPKEIEALFLKQGGAYPSPDPFNASVCGHRPKIGRQKRSETASDYQLPFPALLAGGVAPFAFWYEDDPAGGFVRFLTELECERLMGLPEGWTKYGADGEEIRAASRYKALGNAIALPCAEYIMAGIAEALTKGGANDGI